MNRVSIIIACRNEEKYIANCLESILNSDYSNELIEIKVVDGMSDDNTRNIIQAYSKKYDCVELIDNIKQKTPIAFNLGIKNSSSHYVIFVGARFEISENYISYSIQKLEENKSLGCIGGAIYNNYENKISETISKAMNSSFGVGMGNFRINFKDEIYVDTVSCAVYRMSIFDEIGLFDEQLTRNQDDEFNYRVTKAGYKILSTHKISYKYMVRASFSKLFKQYYQYGYWKVFVNKKHKTITTFRQLVPFFFVNYLLFLLISIFIFYNYLYLILLPLSLYVGLIIYFSNKLSKNFKELFNMSQTFFILHISYGLGYLEGVINFLLLRRKNVNKNNETLSR